MQYACSFEHWGVYRVLMYALCMCATRYGLSARSLGVLLSMYDSCSWSCRRNASLLHANWSRFCRSHCSWCLFACDPAVVLGAEITVEQAVSRTQARLLRVARATCAVHARLVSYALRLQLCCISVYRYVACALWCLTHVEWLSVVIVLVTGEAGFKSI